jgi:hypothetical protein
MLQQLITAEIINKKIRKRKKPESVPKALENLYILAHLDGFRIELRK